MEKSGTVATALLLFATAAVHGQIKRTSVPMGDAVEKSLAEGSLLGEGAHPFHIRVSVSEPENVESPYSGTIEEWWASPSQWRREVTAKGGMRQMIVVADGKKTERGEGYSKVPSGLQGPVMNAISQWTFRSLIRDGKPQYFHGTVKFAVP